MNEIFKTEPINKKDAKGNDRYWIGYVVEENGEYFTRQEFYSKNKEGIESIHTFSELVKVKGKNIGKKNETSPKEQAIKECISLYKKKLDGVATEELFLPMLALDYSSKKATYPAYIQRKEDGVRVLYKNGKAFTRNGKLIDPKVIEHLDIPKVDYILDGELVLPLPYSFQETISAVKKFGPLSKELEYRIFDVYLENKGYENRLKFIENLEYKGKVKLCETLVVNNEEEFKNKASLFIEEGYEGAIYRKKDGLYLPNIRREVLMKYKEWKDEEFVIVGVKDGKGKEEGCAIFICNVNNEKVDVRPRGDEVYRKELFNNRDKLIGKKLTVKYFGYTDEGSLRFPVGIAIRDYE